MGLRFASRDPKDCDRTLLKRSENREVIKSSGMGAIASPKRGEIIAVR